jgi:putative ABC transport system ATP-binding protein
MRARPHASLPPADSEAALFGFHEVGVEIDGTQVLHNMTLDIPASGVTVVVGASGSGKSTLTRLCNRLLDPTDGIVCFRGHDVRTLDVLALRRAVGMVFQRATLFDGTVTDNLAVTGVIDRSEHDRVLAEVGLDLDHEQDASSLSGGEAQRLCLARTLLVDPQVLVADEPTASLDAAAARRLEGLACAAAARGVPVLWVTHDEAQVERIADLVVVLRDGTIVEAESRP